MQSKALQEVNNEGWCLMMVDVSIHCVLFMCGCIPFHAILITFTSLDQHLKDACGLCLVTTSGGQ